MNYAKPTGALKEYSQVGVHSGIASATPHRLIQMLMEGALEKIAAAKGAMTRGDIPVKGAQISWAISIIDGLRMSLDMEAGGEIADNLNRLYDYMGRRLVEANLKNEPAYLDEVANLLKEIKSAWDAIPSDVRKAHAENSPEPPPTVATAKG